jgi:hypothetical protein
MRKRDKETFNYESMHKREGVNWYERRHDYVVDYSAIRGMLRSAVGRPWNKVWSEICHKFDARTLKGKESRDYAKSLVELDPEIGDNGEVLIRRYWFRDGFYVHPVTGILKSVPPSKYKAKKTPLDERIITIGKRAFFKFDGIWYEVLFKSLPPKDPEDVLARRLRGFQRYYHVLDIFEMYGDRNRINRAMGWSSRSFASYWAFEDHYIRKYGKPVYCYNKRQVGKKDIKKINEYIAKYS